ncbi:hypothetical protein MJG53_020126 [Ovis ammon polii x Ovis aries]|uniref:Uncharacterized protein n=2 Tax=Ovis TaxID=9935 RepID=A0A835ZL21_SHEEP|nr:hypothetical protein JEQ12_020475 [Ovis aries]KAI4554827.1 hypothetical protein MJG53_020126 [Ovis ammon polii x Ovis aries]
MERPARLCGLWALLLYAGRGGVAAPAAPRSLAPRPGARKEFAGSGAGVSPVARRGDEGPGARGDGDQGPGVRVTRRGSLRGGSSEVAAVEGNL